MTGLLSFRGFWSLLVLQLKQQYRSDPQISRQRAVYLILPLALLPLVSQIWAAMVALEQVGMAYQAPDLGLRVGLMGATLLGISFGLLHMLSAAYYARDLGRLISLPIAPAAILAVKLVLVSLSELLTMGLFYWPAVLAHSHVAGGAGFVYWLLALLLFPLVPVVPLALAALIGLPVMALTNRRLNRDALRIGVSLLLVLLVLSVQSLLRAVNYQSRDPIGTGGPLVGQMVQSEGLLGQAARYFPVPLWAADALQGDWAALGLFLAATVVLGGLLALAANWIFLAGGVGGGEEAGRGRPPGPRQVARVTSRMQSPLAALFWREVRQFVRTPAYVMQELAGAIVLPGAVMLSALQDGLLSQIVGAGRDPRMLPGILFGGMALMQLIIAANSTLATPISREGRHFWLSKILPVPTRVQIQAKLLFGVASSALLVLAGAVILAAVVGLGPGPLVMFVVGSLLGAVLAAEGGLLHDLWRPHLTWTDPSHALKGNLNGIFASVTHLLLVAVVGAVTGLAALLSIGLAYAVALLTTGALALAFYFPLMAWADQRYNELDV